MIHKVCVGRMGVCGTESTILEYLEINMSMLRSILTAARRLQAGTGNIKRQRGSTLMTTKSSITGLFSVATYVGESEAMRVAIYPQWHGLSARAHGPEAGATDCNAGVRTRVGARLGTRRRTGATLEGAYLVGDTL